MCLCVEVWPEKREVCNTLEILAMEKKHLEANCLEFLSGVCVSLIQNLMSFWDTDSKYSQILKA